MAELGKYYIQIVPSAEGISGNIQRAIAPEASKAGVSSGKIIAAKLGASLQNIGGGLMKAGAIATAVSVPIIAGIKKAMGAYQVQNEAETKLTEIYKTRIGASGQAAQATMKLASAMQKEGVIGDEVALSGAQQLATYASTTKTVDTLIPAMGNLLAQQKGVNATAEDATSIANLFGKAMNGQVGALKRVGISFDENQEKILKTGTEEEKAAMLAEVVTQNVGNMNKKLAETPAGKIQQMKNSLGDLAEGIGATLAPVLSDIAQWISTNLIPKVEAFISFLQGNPIIARIVVGISGLLAVGGPLIIIIGSIVSAIGALIPVVGALSAPVLGVVAAIVAVGAALATAYTKSAPFREAVNGLVVAIGTELAGVVKPAIQFFKDLFAEIMLTVKGIATQLAPIIIKLTPILKKLAQILVGVLKRAFKVVGSVIKVFGATVRALATIFSGTFSAVLKIASGVIGKIKAIFSRVKEALTHPFETAKSVISGIVEKIKGFFNFRVSAPHIPMPHFSIKPAGWKVGDLLKGKIPSLGISWYAKGGIMKEPTLFGGGENGAEAIVPLDPFWKKLDEKGDIDYVKLAAVMVEAFQKSNLTVETVVDGKVIARSTAPYMKNELNSLDTRANRTLGLVGV